jgi:hypothetical protein
LNPDFYSFKLLSGDFFDSEGAMGKTKDPAMTTEQARAVIEEIAQLRGAFTVAFRREAENEAEHGRKGMLQAIKSGEEMRANLTNTLQV